MKCFSRSARRASSADAFTLLELLVVIGIVAVATAMLFPAVQRARALSSTVSCKSNLNQLYVALTQYTVDYGRYPYGFIFTHQNTNNGRPVNPEDQSHIAWFSALDVYLTTDASFVIDVPPNTQPLRASPARRNFAQAFRCPSVPGTFQQQIQYASHGVVMPLMTLELPSTFAGPKKLTAGARMIDVNADTALIWDTPVFSNFKYQAATTLWGTQHTVSGIAPFCTMIDDNSIAFTSGNGLLCTPSFPERRFRGPGADRFAFSTNPLKSVSGPIAIPSDSYVQSLGFSFASYNTDFVGTGFGFPGAPRFRHEGLGCNVLFADGTVRTLYLDPTTTVSGSGSSTWINSDFKRYLLMIKWPPGFKDTNTYPTN